MGILNTGFDNTVNLIGSGLGGSSMTHLARGNGAAAFDVTHTGLDNETARSSAAHEIITTTTTDDTARFHTLAVVGAGGETVTEVGLVSASTGGVFMNRVKVSPIEYEEGDLFFVDLQVSLTQPGVATHTMSVGTSKSVIPDAFISTITKRIAGDDTTTRIVQHAFGVGDTAPTVSDSALATEITSTTPSTSFTDVQDASGNGRHLTFTGTKTAVTSANPNRWGDGFDLLSNVDYLTRNDAAFHKTGFLAAVACFERRNGHRADIFAHERNTTNGYMSYQLFIDASGKVNYRHHNGTTPHTFTSEGTVPNGEHSILLRRRSNGTAVEFVVFNSSGRCILWEGRILSAVPNPNGSDNRFVIGNPTASSNDVNVYEVRIWDDNTKVDLQELLFLANPTLTQMKERPTGLEFACYFLDAITIGGDRSLHREARVSATVTNPSTGVLRVDTKFTSANATEVNFQVKEDALVTSGTTGAGSLAMRYVYATPMKFWRANSVVRRTEIHFV